MLIFFHPEITLSHTSLVQAVRLAQWWRSETLVQMCHLRLALLMHVNLPSNLPLSGKPLSRTHVASEFDCTMDP